ncbi:Crp/Fnr family transcriptional regulator [Fusobacterium perfoetens]|uniref:Crp/Fnr family transcriptional regulator n=1 Tax=Fusobacterium perfoetens TaxID=852 RepID=UPI001F30EF22|nr:Crp/Fnr family transcriptional regulator [Fusobacterium perfoetens]MCF2624982.1 Crp/Fnr family transcriptional regulator [Fusobacterium perfoetens]
MEKLEFLKKLPIFFNLKDEEIISVLKFFKYYEESFKKNDFIFEIEKKIDKIGIIIFGEINIIKEDFWGNRNILNKFREGEIFGEVFALSKASSNIMVEASQDCRILFLDLKNFSIENKKNSEEITKFLSNIFKISLKKNILFTEKLEHISKKSIREKIISYLSTEAQKNKTNSFLIKFDRQELADYLFVERSALSRELSSMKKDRLIDYKKNHFTLIK